MRTMGFIPYGSPSTSGLGVSYDRNAAMGAAVRGLAACDACGIIRRTILQAPHVQQSTPDIGAVAPLT